MRIKLGCFALLLSVAVIGCGGSGSSNGSADESVGGVSAPVFNDDLSPGAGVVTPIETAEPGDPRVELASPNDSGSTIDRKFCQETVRAVSYEAYCSVDLVNCSFREGYYVPQPAGGFGWDGNRVCDLSQSYGVDSIEVLVPYIRRRPDIDGNWTAQWRDGAIAATVNYETRRNNIDNLLLSPVADYLDGAGYSTWTAMHDGTNLYLGVRVSSDYINSSIVDSDEPWHDDSIEIYIDGNNSKTEEYDGVDDFQILLTAESEHWQPALSELSAPGLGIFYRASVSGRGHVYYEVSINLESAGIVPGRAFGFDVHINEDDNGGDRDAKWAWFEKSGNDRSWYRPDVFGTLMLTDCDDRTSCGSYQVLSGD
ncbi:hypothetical protein AB833_18950 [Chromatiales bacterium (ex Bugula neritina AB1)]|nr:hypothetical protein AB833_18950 [Chromatiales bacterium (ex Bugula neritina AB1)]